MKITTMKITTMKITTTILALVLAAVIKMMHYVITEPAFNGSPFTRPEHQARHDAFVEKMTYCQSEIDRANKRNLELRIQLLNATEPGKIALLKSDLEEVKRDLETYLQKFSTAHKGMLRSKHWIEHNSDIGFWKDTDDLIPQDL